MPCAHILVDTQGRTNMSNDSDSVLMIDHDIWWYGKMDRHISPFRSEQLQPASYDVRLSDRLLAYSGDGWIDAETRLLVGDITYDEIHIDEDGYLLQPNEFILGSTIKKFEFPDDIAGRFEGKSSLGRLGLATHITAGFIDPGFEGQITLEIRNMNRVPILIRPGMRIGQICFFRLGYGCLHPYGDPKLGSHYQNQEGPTPAMMPELE